MARIATASHSGSRTEGNVTMHGGNIPESERSVKWSPADGRAGVSRPVSHGALGGRGSKRSNPSMRASSCGLPGRTERSPPASRCSQKVHREDGVRRAEVVREREIMAGTGANTAVSSQVTLDPGYALVPVQPCSSTDARTSLAAEGREEGAVLVARLHDTPLFSSRRRLVLSDAGAPA